MSLSLTIGQKTDIATIADFLDRAGPDARIRARMSGNTTELYVRDMSIVGRLKEWLSTKEEDRKNAYETAKALIANCARAGAESGLTTGTKAGAGRQSSAALQKVLNSISAHQHDFRTKEIGKCIDRLSDDIRQPRAREAVELGIKSLGIRDDFWVGKVAKELGAVDADKLAGEICKLLKKPDHQETIKAGIDSMRTYLDAKSNGGNTSSIDFVAIQQFGTALAGAMNIYEFKENHGIATHCPTISDFLSMQLLRAVCKGASELSAPSNYVFAAPDAPSDAFIADPFSEMPETKSQWGKARLAQLSEEGIRMAFEELPGSLISASRYAICMNPKEDFFSADELTSAYQKAAAELESQIKNHESYSIRVAVSVPHADSGMTFEKKTTMGASLFADGFSALMGKHPQTQFNIVLPPTMTQQDFIDALEENARSRRNRLKNQT